MLKSLCKNRCITYFCYYCYFSLAKTKDEKDSVIILVLLYPVGLRYVMF